MLPGVREIGTCPERIEIIWRSFVRSLSGNLLFVDGLTLFDVQLVATVRCTLLFRWYILQVSVIPFYLSYSLCFPVRDLSSTRYI